MYTSHHLIFLVHLINVPNELLKSSSHNRLYGTVLNHLAKSREDLLLWDGSLSTVTAASTLETVASPFLHDSAATERDLALVGLHERHRFNNEVVFGALCRYVGNRIWLNRIKLMTQFSYVRLTIC